MNADTKTGQRRVACVSAWQSCLTLCGLHRRSRARRFLVASLALAGTVAALEVLAALDLVDYRWIINRPVDPWTVPWNSPAYMLDRDLIHLHKPHDDMQRSYKGDLWEAGAAHITYNDAVIHYDRHGFRNDVEYERADCIVIGDAFVEGDNIASSKQLLTWHLQELLGWSVANLGQCWYGPQQELRVLQKYGLPLAPQVCVWVFYENDLSNFWRYRRLQQRWEDVVRRHSLFRARSLTRNVFDWAARKSLSARNNIPPGKFLSAEVRGPTGRPTRLWFRNSSALTPTDLQALDETKAILAQANELCIDQSTRLLVVFAPLKIRVYDKLCQFEPSSDALKLHLNDLPRRLRESVAEISSDIGFLDLTEVFQEHAQRGAILYPPDDSHWSPEGHRLAGAAIAEYLKSRDVVWRQPETTHSTVASQRVDGGTAFP